MREPLHDMGGRVKDRWGTARRNRLDRQNMRLREEVSHLRTQLEDERTEAEDLKDVLRSSPKVVEVKKRGGLFRVALVGGVAYVVGTKHGRERYDQIVAWVRSMRTKMERNADDMAEAALPQMSNASQDAASSRPAGRMASPTVAERRSGSSGAVPS